MGCSFDPVRTDSAVACRASWLAAAILLMCVPRLPADSPTPLLELPGPLVIVGGGAVPADAREAFVTFAGKDKAKLVVVSTASDDADDPAKAEGFLKQWRPFKLASVQLLHTRDRKMADDPALKESMRKAGADTVKSTPEEFRAQIAAEIAQWKPLIAEIAEKK